MKSVLLFGVTVLLCAVAQAEGAAPGAPAPAKPAAAAPSVAEVKAPTAQQQKMTRCNADANTRKLNGDARKDFMKNCLSAKPAAASTPNASQQRMKDCNVRANEQQLAGEARQGFMSTCLKSD